ncbi:MAG TPA: cyclase family protein [Burkholderiales bacterium]|nr:cyclase family protein [Burkholderiales bacterium]
MTRIALAIALLCTPLVAAAQWNLPPESQRCPSKWGAGDEKGSGNHMKNPQNVLRAARLIKTGEVIELSHVLGPGMAFSGPRILNMQPKRTVMNPGRNTRGSNEEMFTGEFGQIGTQFDGFAHQSHGDSHYNCFKTSEIASRNGFTKLGVQNAPMFFTRGVMIDVAGLKGVEMLGDTYEITPDDLQQALARQGNMKVQPGDAVLIHTGWGKLYGKDNARFTKTTPGVGVAAAEWLAKQDPALVGSDNWPVEVAPNPDKDLSLPGHQIFLVVNGIHILENVKMDELVAKKVYEFAFAMQPLKLYGATGSTVAPAAIR